LIIEHNGNVSPENSKEYKIGVPRTEPRTLHSLLSSTISGGFVSSHQMSLGIIAVDSNTDVLACQLLLL